MKKASRSSSVHPIADPRANLELVRESPLMVKRHNEAGWLNLFSRDSVIEDPVGSGMHTKAGGKASAFYDTFIAPNDIEFKVKKDFVSGSEVARDVVIETRTPSGLKIDVPAHLRYTLTEEDGQLRVVSMRATWELRSMLLVALQSGYPGLRTLLSMTSRMLKNQGLKGTLKYASGLLSGIFHRGDRQALKLAAAIGNCDASAIEALFRDDNYRIEMGSGQTLKASQFLQRIGQLENFEVGAPISAGWNTSFPFQMSSAKESIEGMVFIEFEPRSKKIRSARFLVNEL